LTEGYELYCVADPTFYDAPRPNDTGIADFTICSRPVPQDWAHQATDTWMHYARSDESVPPQGWKIHVSARLADVDRTLDTVWDYCTSRGIAFKFLRGQHVVMMFNGKAAGRGSSGKLATIYPADVDQLEVVLAELDELLAGVTGPYILSDLRYGNGPLFVRYGSFVTRHCLDERGERVLALLDADGKPVPDVRGPVFAIPDWITLPEFLQPHLAARNAVTTTGMPYEIESVLHFSNGGGVYLARDQRTGERVVLKEGRPHAGLDVAGRDAVARVEHEGEILKRLAGLDVVPRYIDSFTVGDHHFLAQEFVDGNPLQRKIVQQYPLSKADCDDAALAEYTEWALDMLDRVERAVAQLHERGVVFNDLHPSNILVTAEQRVVLIDFEVATLAEDRARSVLAHPAFTAPRDREGVDVDRYALACLRFYLFAPQTTVLLSLDRAKAVHLARLVANEFPVPAPLLDDALRTVLGEHPHWTDELPVADVDPAQWPMVRAALSRAIVASATPAREDRLFPGDVAQFSPGGGTSFAYGAAGVLYALAETGGGRFPEHEEWLRKRALDPAQPGVPGFYDGAHGVAYVLDRLGHRQDALDLVERCALDWDHIDLGLFGGLSGIGLNLLHLGAGAGIAAAEPELLAVADRIVDRCAERLGGPGDVPEISGGTNPRAGLLYGSSGPALLFLHAYERSGDTALLDRAADALRQDLRRCVRTGDGSLQLDEGWRTLPYLGEGSAGIGLVLARYLAHRHDEEFAESLRAIGLVTLAGFYVQSGLFAGRSGLLLALAGGLPTPGNRAEVIAAHARRLAWHAMPYGGGLALAGDQLLRLSMDLATGTAGALLALGAAQHGSPVSLPFLPPTAAPDVAAVADAGTANGGTVSLADGRR
jgi:predicted Ser/Thr protein kinase